MHRTNDMDGMRQTGGEGYVHLVRTASGMAVVDDRQRKVMREAMKAFARQYPHLVQAVVRS